MFPHIRVALGLALLLSLISSFTAFAKGGFNFITITGPNIKEAMRVTETALTEDFFTFANFYEDKTKAPADPGVGYEILRYYVDGQHEIVFDRLHYYPETGFVFYDGIENGESEYDGEWYTATPETKTVFEAALSIPAGPAAPVDTRFQALPMLIAVVATGLAALSAFVFWRRKPSNQ